MKKHSKTEVDPMSRRMKHFVPTYLQYPHEPKATPKGRGCLISPGVVQSIWYKINTQKNTGNSLAVQWLGLSTFTAQGLGSIPDCGTKIPQVT